MTDPTPLAPSAPSAGRRRLSLGARKDLKWVFAVLAWSLLTLSSFSLVIYTVSDRKAAVPILGGLLVRASDASLSAMPAAKDGGVGSQLANEIRRRAVAAVSASASGDAANRVELPGVGIAVPLDAKMLANATDGDILALAGQAAAENLWETRPEGLKLGSETASDLGIGVAFTAISMQGHEAALGALSTAVIPALIFAAIAIVFSSGWGRLLTPGLILTLAAGPAALIYSIAGSLGAAATLATDDLMLVGAKAAVLSAASLLYVPAGLGAILVVIALVWAAIAALVGHHEGRQDEGGQTPAGISRETP